MSVICLRPFPPCPNVGSSGIRYGHRHEVTVGFSLLREGLSEVEGQRHQVWPPSQGDGRVFPPEGRSERGGGAGGLKG